MRIQLPPGLTLEGEAWGRRVPLWVEREPAPYRLKDDEDDAPDPPHTLHSQCCEVARGATVYLGVEPTTHAFVVDMVLGWLRPNYRVNVVWPVAHDWQI